MKDLYIYGAGYPDIVKLIEAINRDQPTWSIKGFIDDSPEKQNTNFMGYPIVGGKDTIEQLDKSSNYFFNNVCSTTLARRSVSKVMIEQACRFATLIHPNVDTNYTQIGEGTMITEGVVLGSNVTIGRHCAIRYNAVINHDNCIEDFVFIGPGVTLAGFVTVRSGAYLGTGCMSKERMEIGVNSTVGAGAIVIHPVLDNIVVAGIPAKQLIKDKGL